MSTGFRGPVVYSEPGHLLNGIPFHLAMEAHTIFGDGDRLSGFASDFHHYPGPAAGGTAGGWIATDNAGAATIGLADAINGILRLQTNTTENDDAELQLLGESFKYISGKRLWCAARLAVSDADDMEAAFGLVITDTDIIGGVTDGLHFRKTETGTDFTFVVEKDSTETTQACGLTLTDGDFVVLGFYVDPLGNIFMFAEHDTIAGSAVLHTGTNVANTNAPDNEELRLSFACETGGAAAKTLDVDWVVAAQER
jgi:hypothetical protein